MRGNDGILRGEYGEYPQYVVSSAEQNILEDLYNSNSLNTTGKTYTTDSRKYNEYKKGFNPKTWEEYEYNGRKFVRVIANSYFDGDEFQLSNGRYYKDEAAVWVEVTPIKWIVDEEEDIAISERLLVAGVQFNKENNYKGDFTKTNMYRFINTYLVKDIIPNKLNSFTIINKESAKILEIKNKTEKLIQLHQKIEELNAKIKEMHKFEDEKIELERELIELIKPNIEEKTQRLK